MPLRFVVVGTGRSGTKYVSELFSRLRIPCGHEALFSGTPLGPELIGDASFGIVPSLPSFDGLVFHQTRHPLAVLRSILSTGFFTSPGVYAPYRELITRAVPGLEDIPGPTRKAMHYIVEWNLMAEPFARMRWRVEGLDPAVLAAATLLVGQPRTEEECSVALSAVPSDINSLEHGGVERLGLGWSDIEDCAEKQAVVALARRYGYAP